MKRYHQSEMAGGIFIPILSFAPAQWREVRTVKVKCIKRYSDIKLKKIVEVGDILNVDDERAEHLIQEGVAEITKETEKATGKGKE